MSDPFRAAYLQDVVARFRAIRKQAEQALEQVAEEQWFIQLVPGSNSLAHIVKHMAGNMRSRWRDFLTSDGEKPDRDRDREFEVENDAVAHLKQSWDDGWRELFGAIEALTPDDLDRTVVIRGEPHSVVEAVNRQLGHLAGHAGQIVFLARHLAGERWRTLSIPRGESAEFLRQMQAKFGSRAAEPHPRD